jgi:hypothetical protein
VQVHLVFDLGACKIRRGGIQYKSERSQTNDARRNIKQRFIHVLEPIPENFGYSLGGYSHQEHWAHTRRYLSMNTEAKKVKENSESFITPIGRELLSI